MRSWLWFFLALIPSFPGWAAYDLKEDTASQEWSFVLIDETDGTIHAGETIANTEVKLIKSGGTTETNKNSGGCTEIGSTGRYYCTFDATDTNTAGSLTVVIRNTGSLEKEYVLNVLTDNWYDSKYGTDELDVNLAQMGGAAQSATDLKDFADDGYDPSTNKVQGVALVDDITTKTGYTASPTAGSITDTSLGGALETVFETDFVANYDTTNDRWLVDSEAIGGTAQTGNDIGADTNELQTNQGDWATAVGFSTHGAGDVWAIDATTQQTQGTFGQAIGDPVADATTIYQSVATDATGDNVAADVVAMKAETALIVADTGELQTNQGDWATATGFATTGEIADVPTVLEFNARTQPTADYFDPAADAVANVTLVATTTNVTNQFGGRTQSGTLQTAAHTDTSIFIPLADIDYDNQFKHWSITIANGTCAELSARVTDSVDSTGALTVAGFDDAAAGCTPASSLDGATYVLQSPTGIADDLATVSDSTTAIQVDSQGYVKTDVTKISTDSTAADNLEAAADNYSVTRGLAGTALPAAVADAAGGLIISVAGGLDADAQAASVAAIETDTSTDGVVLADNAITSAKYDESTAYPLTDGGAPATDRICFTVQADAGNSSTQVKTDLTDADFLNDQFGGTSIPKRAVVFTSGNVEGVASTIQGFTTSTDILEYTSIFWTPANGVTGCIY